MEESQLLEDTIQDKQVLKLYKTLRTNENSSDRGPLTGEILNSELCIKFLDSVLQPDLPSSRLSSDEKNLLAAKLNLDINDTTALALVVSAALNQLFIIDNFTGPSNAENLTNAYQNLPEILVDLRKKVDYKALSIDGSEVYHLLLNPWLLKANQLVWEFLSKLGCSRRLLDLEFLVWKHRHLTIYLMVLMEPSETIVRELRKIEEFIFDHHVINEAKENKTQLTRFNNVELCCELLQSALLRDNVTYCRKFFDYATEESGISIEQTGALGKRTRFQQKDIPQLLIKVDRNSESGYTRESRDEAILPNNIKLDDDTLLPDVAFVNEAGEQTNNVESMSFEAQLLMQAKLDIFLRSETMEESLRDEWTLAYLRSITNSATVWPLLFKALAMRSKVERKHMRRVDRSLMQIEELIKTVESSCDTDIDSARLRGFYSTLPLSKWQLQTLLGEVSMDLGLFKNALDIYLKTEFWEGVIKCYSALGQTVKAEEVIRQELAKHETPYLYCLLGDAKDDIELYEKSWTLSQGKFARAKKSIGTYYYVRKQYDKAIDNYEEALKANPSNVSILSLLAYSCLTTERYERAAECYRNITYQDDGNFLAWNNLSKAYIKLNQKERAWRTLREAIKCNYEESKIWENFMLVSIEIGALDDVIAAWHRILEIKSSHKDDPILCALTHALVRKPLAKCDDQYKKLLTDALQLVAKLISTSDCSPRLWVCYFRLLVRENEVSEKTSKLDVDSRLSKIVRALQRATPTSHLADHDWYQVPEKIVRVLDSYDELIDLYRYALDMLGPKQELWRQWKNFKLSVNNAIKTLERKSHVCGPG